MWQFAYHTFNISSVSVRITELNYQFGLVIKVCVGLIQYIFVKFN